MNPYLVELQPYPFQRLRTLLADITPPKDKSVIHLQIGEPQHPTPACITEAITQHLDGLSRYPATQGELALRQACANWVSTRYKVTLDPEREILPVNGSREALFSFIQASVCARSNHDKPIVMSPNPFYQIYEGAAKLAGATPYYLNCVAEHQFQPDFDAIPEDIFAKTQVVIVCSPGNPTGAVMNLQDWQKLFELSDKYGFIIASDECYSEIYFNEAPLGSLEAAKLLGRGFERLIMFTSLSKRSNVPGMRSGFVAGDANLLKDYLLYRTYHGCAMSPTIQHASAAAWQDDVHVIENRALYQNKFQLVTQRIAQVLPCTTPDASFYLWAKAPHGDDEAFTRSLYQEEGVQVLPGQYLAREFNGINPGKGYVRLALVATPETCLEATERIENWAKRHL